MRPLMKKVLLINSNIEILPYPVAPLGISLVASSLKDKYEVKIFDSAFHSTSALLSFIREFNPNYIGVGLRNIDNVTMRKCKWYINEIKNTIIDPVKNDFSIPLIIGGSGFSIAPEQIFEYFNVDYGIIGEAEELFPKLLSCLENGNYDIELGNVISKHNKYTRIKEQACGPLLIPRANLDFFINF